MIVIKPSAEQWLKLKDLLIPEAERMAKQKKVCRQKQESDEKLFVGISKAN